MRVAITGATGFTGGHTLRELLASGHEPVALIRTKEKLERVKRLHGLPDIDSVTGDITNRETIQELVDGCDAIIHTAAVTATGKKSIPLIKETNAVGSRNVLEIAAQAALDPIVYVSSQSVLHPPPDGIYTSSCPISPIPLGSYAESKAEGEAIARSLQDNGCPVVIVWPSGIIGPDDVGVSVAANGIARLLKGPILPLPQNGGILMHDVRDLAEVLVRCLEPGLGPRKYGVFGHYLNWEDTAIFLNEITGRKLKVVRLPDFVFHALGRLGDFLGNANIKFPLDLATSRFMTSLVPGDDRDTRDSLGIQWLPLSRSFSDTLLWLNKNGLLSGKSIPALLQQGDSKGWVK
tara:strand:- start:234 stop:1280 length:1047 start_codon:yes stop_codon:yes gene_type:complete